MAEYQSFEVMSYFTWNIKDISSKLKFESPIFTVTDVKFSMVFQKCDSKYTISMVPVIEDQQPTVPSYAIETSISVMLLTRTLEEFSYFQKTANRNSSGQKECHIVWEEETNFYHSSMALDKSEQENVTFLCVFGPLGQYIKADEDFEMDFCSEYFDSELAVLSNDLDKMRLNEDPSFVLKCGDKTLPVHEVILSARSKKFSEMILNKNLKEKEVEIKDMEFEVLENFISYIYSAVLKDNRPSVHLLKKLYQNAVKYELEPLKFMVSSRLVDILNNAELSWSPDILEQEKLSGSPEIFERVKFSNNPDILNKTSFCHLLLDLLSMADEHEDKSFKKSIILCIVRNNNFILIADAWIHFRERKEMLAMEVYDIFVNEYVSKL